MKRPAAPVLPGVLTLLIIEKVYFILRLLAGPASISGLLKAAFTRLGKLKVSICWWYSKSAYAGGVVSRCM